MNEKKFTGTAVYFLGSNRLHERAATLSITYQLKNNELRGSVHFRGHQTWKSDFPVDGFFDELPEIWELKAFAREHLRKCMRNRLYTHRSITIG